MAEHLDHRRPLLPEIQVYHLCHLPVCVSLLVFGRLAAKRRVDHHPPDGCSVEPKEVKARQASVQVW